MVKEIPGRGFPTSKERVERLMRENGVRGRHKRRYKATTDSKHSLPVARNLLNRNFPLLAPEPSLDGRSDLRPDTGGLVLLDGRA